MQASTNAEPTRLMPDEWDKLAAALPALQRAAEARGDDAAAHAYAGVVRAMQSPTRSFFEPAGRVVLLTPDEQDAVNRLFSDATDAANAAREAFWRRSSGDATGDDAPKAPSRLWSDAGYRAAGFATIQAAGLSIETHDAYSPPCHGIIGDGHAWANLATALVAMLAAPDLRTMLRAASDNGDDRADAALSAWDRQAAGDRADDDDGPDLEPLYLSPADAVILRDAYGMGTRHGCGIGDRRDNGENMHAHLAAFGAVCAALRDQTATERYRDQTAPGCYAVLVTPAGRAWLTGWLESCRDDDDAPGDAGPMGAYWYRDSDNGRWHATATGDGPAGVPSPVCGGRHKAGVSRAVLSSAVAAAMRPGDTVCGACVVAVGCPF